MSMKNAKMLAQDMSHEDLIAAYKITKHVDCIKGENGKVNVEIQKIVNRLFEEEVERRMVILEAFTGIIKERMKT